MIVCKDLHLLRVKCSFDVQLIQSRTIFIIYIIYIVLLYLTIWRKFVHIL